MSEPPRFRRTRRVQERDLDFLGHVNNLVWLRYVIELAEAHAREIGMDAPSLRELGAVWIVRRHEVDYHGSASTGDPIVEETWIESMRGARSVRRSRFSAPDGTPLVEATTHWAFVDAETHRPRRIDRRLLEAYQGTLGG